MKRLVGDELGWRLAGLADGEGCFAIHKDPRKNTYRCAFIVGMRADDRAFLELMRDSLSLGVLYDVRPNALTLQRRPGTNPQVHWKVERKAQVIALARWFDSYPPLSKKGRDFAIWRDAVAAWERMDLDTVAALRRLLSEARAFEAVA